MTVRNDTFGFMNTWHRDGASRVRTYLRYRRNVVPPLCYISCTGHSLAAARYPTWPLLPCLPAWFTFSHARCTGRMDAACYMVERHTAFVVRQRAFPEQFLPVSSRLPPPVLDCSWWHLSRRCHFLCLFCHYHRHLRRYCSLLRYLFIPGTPFYLRGIPVSLYSWLYLPKPLPYTGYTEIPPLLYSVMAYTFYYTMTFLWPKYSGGRISVLCRYQRIIDESINGEACMWKREASSVK